MILEKLFMNKSSSQVVTGLFRTRWFLMVNLLLILFVIFSFAREIIHSRDIAAQIETLQKQSKELEVQHFAIADLKNAVQTESFVEREARLKLGLKKPGESLIILKNEQKQQVTTSSGKSGDPQSAALTTDALAAEKPLANSTKWWYYFFNKQAYREAEGGK
jgi:cell division protein FtsB